MKTTDDGAVAEGRACAAVVLYRPDPVILERLVAGLAGRRLIALANGPIDRQALAALDGGDVALIPCERNVGLGAGLNAAVRRAAEEGYSHVLLLDQDSEPTPDLVSALLARAGELVRAGARPGVVAPRLTPPDASWRPIRYAWREDPRASRRGGRSGEGLGAVDFAPTSGSLLDLAAFVDVGPFREDFFIAGLDVEWGFRAWARGWGSYVARGVTMPHRWGEAASPHEATRPQILRHAPVRNYYYVRNALATARLPHVPMAWRVKSCAILAAQIAVLALKGGRGALKPVRAGLRDGLSGQLGPAPEDAA